MAKVPNGLETVPKISIASVGRTNVKDHRQTTEGRTTTCSEREREFTFAKNAKGTENVLTSPIAIRFSDPDFSTENNNLALRRRLHMFFFHCTDCKYAKILGIFLVEVG